MVRKATAGDSRLLAEMAVQMWDSHTVDEWEKEFKETIDSEFAVFFIKYVDRTAVGFEEVTV